MWPETLYTDYNNDATDDDDNTTGFWLPQCKIKASFGQRAKSIKKVWLLHLICNEHIDHDTIS